MSARKQAPPAKAFRLSKSSIVYRFLKKGWVDPNGIVQEVAFKRWAIHPTTKEEEEYISLGRKSIETAERFRERMERCGRSFQDGEVGELVVGEIEDIPDSDLSVIYKEHLPKHAELHGVPLWEQEDDEGYIIASSLADITKPVTRSGRKDGKK